MPPNFASERKTPADPLSAFDASPDLMCVRDMQGRFVRVNKAWEETLGYALEEVANTPLLSLIHPADVAATRLRMTEANERNEIADFANRYRHRDGRYRLMRWRAHRQGEVIIGRARDVTNTYLERREKELSNRKLQRLLSEMSWQLKMPTEEMLTLIQTLGQTRLTQAQRVMLQALESSVGSLEEVAARLLDLAQPGEAWMAFPGPLEQARAVHAPWNAAGVSLKIACASSGKPLALRAPASIDTITVLRPWILDTLQLLEDHRALHHTLRDLPSQMLGLLSIRLDQEGGFYARRLFSLSARSGLMSVGRAAALLRRLQDTGFIVVDDPFKAGTIRRYRVLPALRRFFVGQLIINLKSLASTDAGAVSALEAIAADEDNAIPLLTDFAEAMVRDLSRNGSSVPGLLNGALLMAKGRAIAISIAARALHESREERGGWIEVGSTYYAERFNVSRAHVRRVIQKLEGCGLVRDPTCSSRVQVTNAFLSELARLRVAECYLPEGLLKRN